tara:strand:+ start:8595 stop:9620 length:1026 start_codon:yes stop_codon:yes gene_type:complete
MKIRLLVLCFFITNCIYCLDGNNSFSYINLDYSARSLAMGGNLISIYDNDISLAQTTPSLLNSKMHNELGFSFVDYFSDIKMVSFYYARTLENIGCFSFGIDANSYGEFNASNEIGDQNLSFTANDQVITFGFGRELNSKISLGVNLSLLNSNYESYNALALSSNISSTYFNQDNDFTATLLVKNIGKQIKSYTSIREEIPLDIQFGLSKKLDHLPLTYSLVFHHLNKYNISNNYSLSSFTNNETGEMEIKDESIAKNILRHIIIGGELNLFKNNFFIQGGFNFQRRFDMTIRSFNGMVGFSYGVGFNVSKINFNYSRSAYHLSGKVNTFSISTNLSTFGL